MTSGNMAHLAYSTAHQTLPKTRQIVMLYDGIIRSIQQARQAIENQSVEERYRLLAKASEIVMGLQGSLDFTADEKVARILFDYYSALDTRLLRLQRSQDVKECDRLVDDLKAMREVWAKIDGEQGNNGDAAAQAEQQLQSGITFSA